MDATPYLLNRDALGRLWYGQRCSRCDYAGRETMVYPTEPYVCMRCAAYLAGESDGTDDSPIAQRRHRMAGGADLL